MDERCDSMIYDRKMMSLAVNKISNKTFVNEVKELEDDCTVVAALKSKKEIDDDCIIIAALESKKKSGIIACWHHSKKD